ncbi:hypothetical protein F5Y15DRAFT_413643 [Xylariaceae sp. FL0016]|nr:hypothetical protein F5Y15DRAFT_413643 [Xylariaceae sp. FL0016]
MCIHSYYGYSRCRHEAPGYERGIYLRCDGVNWWEPSCDPPGDGWHMQRAAVGSWCPGCLVDTSEHPSALSMEKHLGSIAEKLRLYQLKREADHIHLELKKIRDKAKKDGSFSNFYNELFEGQNVSDEYMLLNNYEDFPQDDSLRLLNRERPENTTCSATPMHYDRAADISLLRTMFDNVVRVDSFGAAIEPAASQYHGYEDHFAESYDLPTLNSIIQTLYCGLKSPAFQYVVNL